MQELLDQNKLILIEAAIVERLRRSGHVALHPRLVNATLIYDESGRAELRKIYQSYIDIARNGNLPLLLCTPTWRANRERVIESGVDENINVDAVKFMNELRRKQGSYTSKIIIGGLIGCKNDCYKPEEALSSIEAAEFHEWQITQLAKANLDFLIAETLPDLQEAIGIAKAMMKTNVPYIISFVINRNGDVLDGTPLVDAIRELDNSVGIEPLGYMVNCAYPEFLNAASQPIQLFDRLIGYQANASALDHAELDNCSELQMEDLATWGNEMLNLNKQYGVNILGGCCGTGVDHLKYLVRSDRIISTI